MVILTVRWLSGELQSYEGECVADIVERVTQEPPYRVLFFCQGELVTYYQRFSHDTELDILIRDLPSIYIQFEQNSKECYANLFRPLEVYEGKAPEGKIFVDYQSHGHALLHDGRDRLCYRDFVYFCTTMKTYGEMREMEWREYIRLGSFLLSPRLIQIVFPIDPDVLAFGRMTAKKWYQWFAVTL